MNLISEFINYSTQNKGVQFDAEILFYHIALMCSCGGLRIFYERDILSRGGFLSSRKALPNSSVPLLIVFFLEIFFIQKSVKSAPF